MNLQEIHEQTPWRNVYFPTQENNSRKDIEL